MVEILWSGEIIGWTTGMAKCKLHIPDRTFGGNWIGTTQAAVQTATLSHTQYEFSWITGFCNRQQSLFNKQRKSLLDN